jgi:hypothetical protein
LTRRSACSRSPDGCNPEGRNGIGTIMRSRAAEPMLSWVS